MRSIEESDLDALDFHPEFKIEPSHELIEDPVLLRLAQPIEAPANFLNCLSLKRWNAALAAALGSAATVASAI